MDAVLTGLLQFGIGGIMAAAVITFGWFLVTKLVPQLLNQREGDLVWCRNQIELKRIQFMEELASQRKDLLAALQAVQQDNQKSLSEVMAHCDKEVSHLSEQLTKEIDRLGSAIGHLTVAVNDLRKEGKVHDG